MNILTKDLVLKLTLILTVLFGVKAFAQQEEMQDIDKEILSFSKEAKAKTFLPDKYDEIIFDDSDEIDLKHNMDENVAEAYFKAIEQITFEQNELKKIENGLKNINKHIRDTIAIEALSDRKKKEILVEAVSKFIEMKDLYVERQDRINIMAATKFDEIYNKNRHTLTLEEKEFLKSELVRESLKR